MGKGAFLGEFEQMVLLAVVRLDQDGYGMRIRQTIEERANRPVTIGAVYAALERLERKGLVRSWESAPEPIRGGRAKSLYGLTTLGKRALHHAQEAMRRMAEGLAFDSDLGAS